ncbi:MAG: LuxR C-terminal-related transcriptional regulator [Candidatus Korobacteraceae bacterium]
MGIERKSAAGSRLQQVNCEPDRAAMVMTARKPPALKNASHQQPRVLDESLASGGWQEVLTPKEVQLLELLSYGYENGDIADHFQTSLQAVKNMLRTINLKLGADNRTHAVSICFRNNWLPLGAHESIIRGHVPQSKSNGRRGPLR